MPGNHLTCSLRSCEFSIGYCFSLSLTYIWIWFFKFLGVLLYIYSENHALSLVSGQFYLSTSICPLPYLLYSLLTCFLVFLHSLCTTLYLMLKFPISSTSVPFFLTVLPYQPLSFIYAMQRCYKLHHLPLLSGKLSPVVGLKALYVIHIV